MTQDHDSKVELLVWVSSLFLQCFELMDTENELLHVFDKLLSLEQFYVLYFEPYLIIS